MVLGFPCNQFLEQEPGSDEEIKTYCTTTWGVTFRCSVRLKLMAKDAIRCIKIDCRSADRSRAGRSGFYARMVSKGRAPLYLMIFYGILRNF